MRLDTKTLFNENTSPFVKSIIMKRRSGIQLTEKEEKRFKREVSKLHESVVSMVEIPKNSDRMSPTQSLKNTFGSKKSIEDMDDDEEIDLEEILREMGYEEEPEEEFDLGDYDEDELKEYIRNQIRESFYEELDNLDYEEGPIGDELELDEIVMSIEDDGIEENVTYDIDYASYTGGSRKYHNIRRTFNNEPHFNNWYRWMNKQGLKIIGVHPIK
jgi:hypothetical protein